MNPDTIIILTLPAPVAEMLDQMAIATEQSSESLAASLLAEVLQDDALAHGRAELSVVSEPAPEPEKAEKAKALFRNGKDTAEIGEILGVAESAVDKLVRAEPAPKRKPGSPAGRKTDKLPKLRKKTAAEIRHEARTRDPIVAERYIVRQSGKKVCLECRRIRNIAYRQKSKSPRREALCAAKNTFESGATA